MRLVVALRRFTQQAVVPVTVGDLPGRVESPLFQITRPGIETHFRLRRFLRLFALNIDQPARRAAAVEHGGRTFQNIDALN
ncbi:hypothetical protein D3C85_1814440 [compost metagenome]